jgi:hypothetical protein
MFASFPHAYFQNQRLSATPSVGKTAVQIPGLSHWSIKASSSRSPGWYWSEFLMGLSDRTRLISSAECEILETISQISDFHFPTIPGSLFWWFLTSIEWLTENNGQIALTLERGDKDIHTRLLKWMLLNDSKETQMTEKSWESFRGWWSSKWRISQGTALEQSEDCEWNLRQLKENCPFPRNQLPD